MNKTKKALQLLLVLALTVLCFAACGTRTHTVTFHTGGDASITQLVADGKSVSEPKVVLGENEEVVGWYTQENGGERFDFSMPVTEDTELWARYGKTHYTVTYAVSADEKLTETVRADGKATEPKVKCADGVYIEGWYNSDTFAPATRHDFAAAINSDTTLYPNYVNESYTVTFTYAAEGMTPPAGGSFDRDGGITFPQAETRVGYEFKGWSDGKGLYFYGDTYPVSENLHDLSFTAVWEYKTVKVRFFGDNGIQIGGDLTLPFGSQIIAPDEDAAAHRLYPLYRLSGWDKDLTSATEDMDVTAIYSYQASALELFDFELNDEGNGWIVSKSEGVQMPNAIAIPDSYENLPVVGIADFGFEAISYASGTSNTKYEIVGTTAVILPDSIKTIGVNAFGRNIGLETITVFDTNEHFLSLSDGSMLADKDGALIWASLTLTDVVIPREVTTIRDAALFFGGVRIHPTTGISYSLDNSTLLSVTIKGDVERLPSATFGGCKNLAEVVFDGGTVKYVEGYKESGDYPVSDKRNDGAFAASNGKLKSIAFPEGLIYIGSGAFVGQRLTSVSLPASLETLQDNALSYNSSSNTNSLQSLTLADGNKNYALDAGFAFIEKGDSGDRLMFCAAGKENVGAYVIPSTVASLAENAFNGASTMTSVTVPESVSRLEKGVFDNCSALTSAALPATLTSIGEGAFGGCWMLEEINLSETAVRTIESNAFSMCSSLVSVNLPVTAVQIALDAFSYCDMLTEINAAPQSEYFSTKDGSLCSADGKTLLIYPVGLLAVNNGAFVSPEGIEVIVGGLLNRVFGVQTIEFKEGVKTVEGYFAPYTTARTVTFPSTIEEIGYGAFSGNRSATVYIFNGVSVPAIDCPLPTFGNGSDPGRTQVRFSVPVDAYADWYRELFIHGLSGRLTTLDNTLPVSNFRFVNTDGDNLSNIQGAAVDTEPVPVCATANKYFAGWWSKDGSADGDWGERAIFPITGVDGESITVYARWADAETKDGRSLHTAYEVDFNDWSKLSLSDGRWYVRVRNIQTTANNRGNVYIYFDVNRFGNVVWFDYYEFENEGVTNLNYTVAARIATESGFSSYPFEAYEAGQKYEAVFVFEIKGMTEPCDVWFSAQFAIDINSENYISQPS